MDSHKSRGLKHVKDKRKYKGNSTKISKYVPTKLQPNLESNWHRYEDDLENEDGAMEYSILAGVPITKGTQFQTKSDKLLTNETESSTFDGLFSLNLEKLEENLMTIPFYKRVGVDENYFSNRQIHDMNSESENFLKKCIKPNDGCSSLSKQNHQISTNNHTKSKDATKSETTQDIAISIQENLILEETPTIVEKEITETSENPEELEKWLDDFLNT
ncbi:uncharacterized protein LOC130896354 [Diorhabda carinulata]|uniref:uncharacterized protein LOC130896354 n=1 Tax=Diorhabda carinulata TaxID=1163345 RepID=UPI0025A149F4|nr:uncharacterized protein LOC130896354 [Diorhabda carinulata]